MFARPRVCNRGHHTERSSVCSGSSCSRIPAGPQTLPWGCFFAPLGPRVSAARGAPRSALNAHQRELNKPNTPRVGKAASRAAAVTAYMMLAEL